MKKLILALLAVAVLAAPTMAFAECNCKASPWTTKTTYKDKSVGKLEFGIKNFFGGWTEIFTEPKEAHDAKTNVWRGVGEGLWNAVADTIGGILHIATFPITGLDVPLPEGGTTIGS